MNVSLLVVTDIQGKVPLKRCHASEVAAWSVQGPLGPGAWDIQVAMTMQLNI